jgi:hypothetical protein
MSALYGNSFSGQNQRKKLDLGKPDAGLSAYKSKFDQVLEPFCYVERTSPKGKRVYFAYKSCAAPKS